MLIAAILTSLVAQAADLDRIRKGLEAAAPAVTAPADDGRPVFRVTVRGTPWERPLWQDNTMRPAYVRPVMPPVHFEFLSQTTNEYFRAGVLYPPPIPMSLPLLSGLQWLAKSGAEKARRKREGKAREEVQQELDAFLKARKGGQVF